MKFLKKSLRKIPGKFPEHVGGNSAEFPGVISKNIREKTKTSFLDGFLNELLEDFKKKNLGGIPNTSST